MNRNDYQFSDFAKARYPQLVERFRNWKPREKSAMSWRRDAAELHKAGWPLALSLNHHAPHLEAKGKTLREPAEILKLHALCEACPLDQFDGRKCRLCRGGCAGKEKEYLVAIATVGGKCLSKDKPLF